MTVVVQVDGEGKEKGPKRDRDSKKNGRSDWATAFCTFCPKNLFLAALVSLIEHIHTTGGVHQLHLARVERVGSLEGAQLRVTKTVSLDISLKATRR